MLQHGAYTLLIDACYDREQFPTRDDAIEWAWASSAAEIEAVEFVLRKFFTLTDGVYVQSRIKEEIDEYHGKAETNSRIAKERETKRKEKSTIRARTVNEPLPEQHEPPPNHKPLTINQEPLKDIGAKAPALRFVKPSISELILEFNTRVPDPLAEANKFLNYYESNGWKVGKNPMKSWKHAVTNWVGNHKSRAPPIAQGRNIIEHAQDRSWAGE